MEYIAILALGSQPSRQLDDYTALRLGAMLSGDPSLVCIAVSVDDFVLGDRVVGIKRGLRFEGGQVQEHHFENPVRPCYVFFVHNTNRKQHAVCLKLLARISQQGIPTNYDSDASSLGVKSVLEERCLAYEFASGRTIPRPKTIIVKGEMDKDGIIAFMRSVGPCIIKPHNDSRSRGVKVLTTEDQVHDLQLNKTWHVVQELLSDPLLMDGCKTGLRVYLMVSDLKRSYVLAEEGLVKLADHPYLRGDPQAEIVGPYMKRAGSWPVIYLLRDLVRSQQTGAEWREIRRCIEKTIDLFMEAVSWRAGMHHIRFPSIQVWGIDILVKRSDSGFTAYLIEVNTLPQLYREDIFTDNAVDSALRDELFSKVVSPSQELTAV